MLSTSAKYGLMRNNRPAENYKLSLYHDKDLGELYDLENDPWEFEDLWDHADYQVIKNRLIYESFNAHVVLTTDVGSKRIAPM